MVHFILKFTSSYFVSYHILYSMPKQNQKIRETSTNIITFPSFCFAAYGGVGGGEVVKEEVKFTNIPRSFR